MAFNSFYESEIKICAHYLDFDSIHFLPWAKHASCSRDLTHEDQVSRYSTFSAAHVCPPGCWADVLL